MGKGRPPSAAPGGKKKRDKHAKGKGGGAPGADANKLLVKAVGPRKGMKAGRKGHAPKLPSPSPTPVELDNFISPALSWSRNPVY